MSNEFDNIYEAINYSLKSRVESISVSSIRKYLAKGYSRNVQRCAQYALENIQSRQRFVEDTFDSTVKFNILFKKHYIKLMILTSKISCNFLILDSLFNVKSYCTQVLMEIKELNKEISEYINRFEILQNTICNQEDLKESLEVSKLNGEEVSIDELANRFQDNGYFLHMVQNLQRQKSESQDQLELIEYEISVLRLIQKSLNNRRNILYKIKEEYTQKQEYIQRDTAKNLSERKLVWDNMSNLVFNSHWTSRKFLIETFAIEHEEENYSGKWICNWLKNTEEEIKGWYKQ